MLLGGYKFPHKGMVTNYGEGGAIKRDGGHVKFYPLGAPGAECTVNFEHCPTKRGWGQKKFKPC